MKALALAAVNVRRMLRERSNVFFVFVFPMLLILVLGVSFGGAFEPKIGVVAVDPGPLAADLVRTFEAMPDVEVERFEDVEEMRTSVERGQLQAGIVLPGDYDDAIRAGQDVQVRYIARQDQLGSSSPRPCARRWPSRGSGSARRASSSPRGWDRSTRGSPGQMS